ncbi:DUF2062 domain-containing protein [bacterium]|nr:DUF2062 domain-containing protein [bacterium]
MFAIRLLYRFIALFQTHANHHGISLGICAGMALGLSPQNSLHFWLLIALCFLIRLNLAATLISWGMFWLVAMLGKPAFFVVGDFLLNKKSLISLWNWLYELPFFPYTNFYVPNILGQMFFTTLIWLPLHIFSHKAARYLEPAVYHWWRTTKLYMLYRGYKPYAR